jgi:hypothetical protein
VSTRDCRLKTPQPWKMALDGATIFKDFRDALYEKFMSCACTPNVEINGVMTSQPEKRFFPTGTAERILDPKILEQLLFGALWYWGQLREGYLDCPLSQIAVDQKLHIFLAILIVSQCDAQTLARTLKSVVNRVLLARRWTELHEELTKLPLNHDGSLQKLCEDHMLTDIFMKKQHEFFAPIIKRKTEIRGPFRRLPYTSEKVIGQGSLGQVYAVVVRLTYGQ